MLKRLEHLDGEIQLHQILKTTKGTTMNDAHSNNDGNIHDYLFANSTQKTEPPTAQERRAFSNVMGIHKPVTFDQAECDAKISKVVKDASERPTQGARDGARYQHSASH
jgi:hypothetical protein